MLFKLKKQKKTYDKENFQPVLQCSICTGEQTAGFRNIHTGKIEDVALIRTSDELKQFMETYGINEIVKVY